LIEGATSDQFDIKLSTRVDQLIKMPILAKMTAPAPNLPSAPSTGVKQTIQARSGMATFVPKGSTISVINTYGRQVVDMWAFALHDAPPTEQEMVEEENMEKDFLEGRMEDEEPEEKEKDLKVADETSSNPAEHETEKAESENQENSNEGSKKEETGDVTEEKASVQTSDETTQTSWSNIQDESQQHSEERSKDKPKEAVEGDAEKLPTGWKSYIPSVKGKLAQGDSVTQQPGDDNSPKTAKSWSSYIPSIPIGRKSATDSSEDPNQEKRSWASFIPSGQGFSSYIPKETLASIASIHRRDNTKSVAEQLYDFSKTPLGAAGLSGKFLALKLMVLKVITFKAYSNDD
jgi:hypothetical protein